MPTYRVTWEIDVEVQGCHREAAQAVANDYFQARIADGEPDSACHFIVTGEDCVPVDLSLAPSLWDIDENE